MKKKIPREKTRRELQREIEALQSMNKAMVKECDRAARVTQENHRLVDAIRHVVARGYEEVNQIGCVTDQLVLVTLRSYLPEFHVKPETRDGGA